MIAVSHPQTEMFWSMMGDCCRLPLVPLGSLGLISGAQLQNYLPYTDTLASVCFQLMQNQPAVMPPPWFTDKDRCCVTSQSLSPRTMIKHKERALDDCLGLGSSPLTCCRISKQRLLVRSTFPSSSSSFFCTSSLTRSLSATSSDFLDSLEPRGSCNVSFKLKTTTKEGRNAQFLDFNIL